MHLKQYRKIKCKKLRENNTYNKRKNYKNKTNDNLNN